MSYHEIINSCHADIPMSSENKRKIFMQIPVGTRLKVIIKGGFVDLAEGEVDALRPDILSQLVNDSILNEIDFDIYKNMVKKEEVDKKKLKSFTTKK